MSKVKKIVSFIVNPFTINIKNKKIAFLLNYFLPILVGGGMIFYNLFFYTKIKENDQYAIYAESIGDSLSIYKILDTVNSKMGKVPLDIKITATLCFSKTESNYLKSNFFLGRYTAGRSYWILNRIILAPSDFEKNQLIREIDTFNTRRLSDVIVHELTHIYIRKKIGVFKTLFLETWKKEGYCEYIANCSTIDINYAKNIFLNYTKEQEQALIDKRNFHSHIYEYFKHRIKVDYLLSYKKVDFNTFINTDYDTYVLENEIKESLVSGKYKFEKQ